MNVNFFLKNKDLKNTILLDLKLFLIRFWLKTNKKKNWKLYILWSEVFFFSFFKDRQDECLSFTVIFFLKKNAPFFRRGEFFSPKRLPPNYDFSKQMYHLIFLVGSTNKVSVTGTSSLIEQHTHSRLMTKKLFYILIFMRWFSKPNAFFFVDSR